MITMKKIILLLSIFCICLFLTSCNNKYDKIEIYNKSTTVFDNILIDTKEGYFYDKHEKFTIDENTIGITIYFSNEKDTWDNKKGEK